MFIQVTKKIKFEAQVTDKFGNPAKVDGKLAWALNDSELGSLEVSEDGFSAVLTPSGKLGIVKAQAKGDADLGQGVKEIFGESEGDELIAGDAEKMVLKSAEAVEAPAEPVPA